jgi:hypothetical protein
MEKSTSPDESTNSDSANVQVNNMSCKLCFFAYFLYTPRWLPSVLKQINLLDRLLTPIIFLAMVVGVLIGVFVDGVQKAFDLAKFDSVSVREYYWSSRIEIIS